MTHPRFFGYGSLVNCATHAYPETQTATLTGWCREWVCVPAYEVAVLSVRAEPATSIDGLTADVPHGDWDALDKREANYARAPLDQFPQATWIYAVPEHRQVRGDHPILLSYLDVVIQGFLDHFGDDGAQRFFRTTDKWQPILNDRDTPRYPRHQSLDQTQTLTVDALLAQHDLKIL